MDRWAYGEARNIMDIMEVIEMLTTIFWLLLFANFSVPSGGIKGPYAPLYSFIWKMISEGWTEMKEAQAKKQQAPQETTSL